MIDRNASMADVLSASATHDACVVLPTLEHAVIWWPRIQEMVFEKQRTQRTKTAILCSESRMILRLWVPYEHDPTMPMDFRHDFVYRCDYLLLYGLSSRRDVKWV